MSLIFPDLQNTNALPELPRTSLCTSAFIMKWLLDCKGRRTVQADGLVLKGKGDTWLELEFAEATVRLGKDMEKGPLLRAKRAGMVCRVGANQRRWF